MDPRLAAAALLLAASPAERPTSSLAGSLSLDLRPLVEEADSELPRVLEGKERRLLVPGLTTEVRYRIERLPTTIEVRGDHLHVDVPIRYRASLCARIGMPPMLAPCIPVASCGVDEQIREALLRIDTALSVTPAWQLEPATRLSLEHRRPCDVTALRVDLTKALQPVFDEELGFLAAQIDREIASLEDLPPIVGEAWAQLQRPIELGEGAWIAIRPMDVIFGGLEGEGTELKTRIAVLASPRITVGGRPKAGELPLPPLRTGDIPSGFRVETEARLPMDELGRRLTEELKGKRIRAGGLRLQIEKLEVKEASGGAVAIRVATRIKNRLLPHFRIRLRLTAHPTYDPKSDRLLFDDLRVDVESRASLIRRASRLVTRRVEKELGRRLSESLAVGLEKIGDALEARLDGLREGVLVLDAEGLELRAVGVEARGGALVVRARAEGRLDVRIEPESPAP